MKTLTLAIVLLLSAGFSAVAQSSFLEKGNSYLNNRQFDKAEETFRAAVKSDTTNLIYQCQLGLTLIEAKKYAEAEVLLDNVLKKDINNVAALWYSGIGNFYNAKHRQAIGRFESALALLNSGSGQYAGANWFIGRCYSNLLRTEGLTYAETDRMLECYETYLKLQPNAEDALKIKEYIAAKKKKRPFSNVARWVDL